MRLSAVYQKTMWVMVYHIQPDSEIVELVTNKLFETKKKALKWFARKRKPEEFVQPEAVKVSGLHNLELQPDRMLDSALDRKCWVPRTSDERSSSDERPTLVLPTLEDEETFGVKP